MRYLTAGESHGEAIIGIIEGLPSGLKVTVGLIDELLKKRQDAFGRGERMKIADRAHILSGVSGSVTTGAPLCIVIPNGDCAVPPFNFFRPGHVDYAASVKYGIPPHIGAERASARETAMRTALGAVALALLNELGIKIDCSILEVGGSCDFAAAIEAARLSGDTLGGRIKLVISGLKAGVGSHAQWDRRLDTVLGGALFSIPSVKAVECGLGVGFSQVTGKECADEMSIRGGKITRTSNNCGGVEGGISNGENVEFTLTIKPIPSLAGLNTVNEENVECLTQKVRGDVCAVGAACTVAEAVAALELTRAILDCLGGDTMEELKERYDKKRGGVCKK